MKLSYGFVGACLSAALLAACGGVNNSASPSTPSSVTSQSVWTQHGQSRSAGHRFKKTSQTMTYLHSFGGYSFDGSAPYGPLVSVNGTVYGTTYAGGSGGHCNCGTVYSVTPSGTYTVLHTFLPNGDGAGPYAGLLNFNGTLYGTTVGGGSYGNGTVYSISPTPSGSETVLQSFYSGSDGDNPIASLIASGSTFYGTTSQGGVYNAGTVFSMTAAGAETVLHSFGGPGDGTGSLAPLLNVGGNSGKLYGTTPSGGATPNCGTVFAVSKTNGAESILHNFSGQPDGCTPQYGSLIMLNGSIYGTTSTGGGGCNCGTVFAIALSSGTETILHSFSGGTDGRGPYGGLAVINGTLYGTTSGGGAYGQGTVFSISPTTSSVGDIVIWAFGGQPGGAQPESDLIAVNGVLYGTTVNGGASNQGTVFSLLSI